MGKLDKLAIQVQALSAPQDRDELIRVLETALKGIEAPSSSSSLSILDIPACMTQLEASAHTVGMIFLLSALAPSATDTESPALPDESFFSITRNFFTVADFPELVQAGSAVTGKLGALMECFLAVAIRCGQVKSSVATLLTSAQKLAQACGYVQ